MIRNIMFDLGNVLTPFDWRFALNRLAPLLPEKHANTLEKDETSFRRMFFAHVKELESGAMDFQEFHARINAILEINLPMELFKEIWCDIFTPDWSMVELGEELSKRYSTWLVSNTNSAHYEWLMEKCPRVGFYRDAGLSYELGAMKPDDLYYQRALERFGAEARESVFIDDLEANVRAASRAGFHGVLFKDIHGLKRELTGLGITLSNY